MNPPPFRVLMMVILALAVGVVAVGCSSSGSSYSRGLDATLTAPSVSGDRTSTETVVRYVPPSLDGRATPVPTQEADPVVVTVNGIDIRLSEYRDGLQEYLRQQNGNGDRAELESSYQKRLVDELLLYDYGRRVGLDDDPDFQSRLKRLHRQLLVDTVRRKRVLSQVEVTSDDVRRYYEQNASDFSTPQQVQVRAIQTATYRDAEKVRAQLAGNPERFGELALENSIHPSRSRGGEMEPFARGTYAEPFEDVAFSLQVGETSPIIATEQGYFIIEKLGEIPEQRPPLEEIRPAIEQRLLKAREQEILDRFLESLRQFGMVDTRWIAP